MFAFADATSNPKHQVRCRKRGISPWRRYRPPRTGYRLFTVNDSESAGNAAQGWINSEAKSIGIQGKSSINSRRRKRYPGTSLLVGTSVHCFRGQTRLRTPPTSLGCDWLNAES